MHGTQTFFYAKDTYFVFIYGSDGLSMVKAKPIVL